MGNGVNNKGPVIPVPPAPPAIKSTGVNDKSAGKISVVEAMSNIEKGKNTSFEESLSLQRKALFERRVSDSDDSGISSIASDESNPFLNENESLPLSSELFSHTKEELDKLKNLIDPEQYSYVSDCIDKLERTNNNLEHLEKALKDKSRSLLDKERDFIDYTGMLPHIDEGTTSPEGALFAAKGFLELFSYLLHQDDIDKRLFFENFFARNETCFEGRCAAAQRFHLDIEFKRWEKMDDETKAATSSVLNIDAIAEYGSHLEIETILNNEVLAYQKINNLDPVVDIVSGGDFKAYLMSKGKDCLGYQAKNGVITEEAIDAFIAQQIEDFTMDP